MKDVLNYIDIFLNQRNLRAKDIIIVSISSSFIFWLISRFLDKLILFIRKLIKLNYEKIRKIHRKYIKKKLTVSEYKEIIKRLKNGENLKWYEIKSYYINKEKAEAIKLAKKEIYWRIALISLYTKGEN